MWMLSGTEGPGLETREAWRGPLRKEFVDTLSEECVGGGTTGTLEEKGKIPSPQLERKRILTDVIWIYLKVTFLPV